MNSKILLDQTSVANTAIDVTVPIPGPTDAVLIEVSPSGAMTSGNLQAFDPDLSTGELCHWTTGTSTTPIIVGWGVGVGGAAAQTTYLGGIPAPLPQKIRIVVPALGAGVTGRLRIVSMYYGR